MQFLDGKTAADDAGVQISGAPFHLGDPLRLGEQSLEDFRFAGFCYELHGTEGARVTGVAFVILTR